MKLARGLRPKGVDVDKPEGYIKLKLRRWWRREISRWTRKDCAALDPAPQQGEKSCESSIGKPVTPQAYTQAPAERESTTNAQAVGVSDADADPALPKITSTSSYEAKRCCECKKFLPNPYVIFNSEDACSCPTKSIGQPATGPSDTEMLDWMEKKALSEPRNLKFRVDRCGNLLTGMPEAGYLHDTVRAAIRAAMAEVAAGRI